MAFYSKAKLVRHSRLWFTVLFLAGFISLLQNHHKRKEISYYSTDHALELYQTLKDMHELFVQEHLPYFVCGGTLLGAVRHQGQIPWDDDLDIMIMEEDEPKLLLLKSKIENLGYKLRRVYFGYKIYNGFISVINGKAYSINTHAVLDIFLMRDEKNMVHFNHIDTIKFWPHKFFLRDEIYPLKLYTFGNLKVYGPNKFLPYIERSFGKDWDNSVVKNFHDGLPLKHPIKIPLKPEDKLPAYPLGPLQNRINPKGSS